MPKLPSLKPRDVVKKLKRLGFAEHHQVGSHLTMKQPATGRRAVIPMHLKDIKRGTLLSLLREAGVEKDEFILPTPGVNQIPHLRILTERRDRKQHRDS